MCACVEARKQLIDVGSFYHIGPGLELRKSGLAAFICRATTLFAQLWVRYLLQLHKKMLCEGMSRKKERYAEVAQHWWQLLLLLLKFLASQQLGVAGKETLSLDCRHLHPRASCCEQPWSTNPTRTSSFSYFSLKAWRDSIRDILRLVSPGAWVPDKVFGHYGGNLSVS